MILNKSIYLRAVEEKDLELLKQWRNNEDFRTNFREIRELSTNHQVKWLERLNADASSFMFSICDAQTDEIIGAGGLLYINWVLRSADFSFYIGKDNEYVSNSAYSIDASEALINYGFHTLNLNKIWMELYDIDQRKLDFFKENFNFKVDGLLRQNAFINGKYHHSFILSLLRDEI